MVGEDQDASGFLLASYNGARIAVAADRAGWAEDVLASMGLCNWLVDYGEAHRVYCARPASGGLCSDHAGTFGVPI